MRELNQYISLIYLLHIAIIVWLLFVWFKKKSESNHNLFHSAFSKEISTLVRTMILLILWILYSNAATLAILAQLFEKYRSLFYLLIFIILLQKLLSLANKVVIRILDHITAKAYK
ncbi:MAG TPA: hypothetical protein DEA51_02965 [Erysipelotrichaceae bacterium]|nr:hypothetical protein [Erysipelotrichaceae bacterium]